MMLTAIREAVLIKTICVMPCDRPWIVPILIESKDRPRDTAGRAQNKIVIFTLSPNIFCFEKIRAATDVKIRYNSFPIKVAANSEYTSF